MKILFVIVTYNAMPWIDNCFQSIANMPSGIEHDAFVVDNGSSDGTQTYLNKHYPWVIFQQSAKNLGFGRANNIGLQYAIDNDYDYVYLLNQDAWIFPETIKELIKISITYPEYGIISPFQMSADNYSIDRGFSERLKSWPCFNEMLNDIYNNNSREIYEADSVMAAHWFMTRKCVEKVGGFSPTFSHYGEDDNYSERVKYKGFKIGVAPKLKVVHDRQWRKADKSKMIYQSYTECLFKLSSPTVGTFSRSFFSIVRQSIRSSSHYKSFIPFKYLFSICSSLKSISHNRTISMTDDCAFLVNKKIIK